VEDLANSGIPVETAVVADSAAGASDAAAKPDSGQKRSLLKELASYLLDSEVHTFAFSVAANAILSFIPFIVLLYTLVDTVFHRSEMMKLVINDMIVYFLPSSPDLVIKSLNRVANLASRHGIQVFSLIMILVACTGIFLPLEVALNKAWGVTKSRNYLANQVVSFGLAILMLALGMGCIVLNAKARYVVAANFSPQTDSFMFHEVSSIVLATSTGVASILFFFSIYWLLPNRKISPWPVLRTAIFTGIIWLVSKYAFEAVLPHMHLEDLYGRFDVSVSLLFWAYVSGLILFAGAKFSVGRMGEQEELLIRQVNTAKRHMPRVGL
jgi:membrane protein/epoxyqueuosine reductase